MVVLALEFRHLSSSCSWPLLTVYGDETAPLDVGHQSHLFLSLLFFLLSCRCKRTTANMYDTQGQQQTNKQTLTPLPKNSPAAVHGQKRNGARTPRCGRVSATIAVAKEKYLKKKKKKNCDCALGKSFDSPGPSYKVEGKTAKPEKTIRQIAFECV